MQFEIEFNSTAFDIGIEVSPNIAAAEKLVYVAERGPGLKRVLLVGMNRHSIPNGSAVDLIVTARPNAPESSYPLRLLNAVGVDADGAVVPVSTSDGVLTLSRSGQVRIDGVSSAASFLTGAVSPGQLVSIMGSGFTETAQVFVNGSPAAILYAGSTQINAALPDSVGSADVATIEVSTANGKASFPVSVTESFPGIFTQSMTGTGPGSVLNQNLSLNSRENPAEAGSVIAVYLTGLGRTDTSVTGEIAQRAAEVLYAGPAPGLLSVAQQVNLRIPAGTASGEQSLAVVVGSARSQPGVIVYIR
jgi:uncharacterized protein (TIGR03437 family)